MSARPPPGGRTKSWPDGRSREDSQEFEAVRRSVAHACHTGRGTGSSSRSCTRSRDAREPVVKKISMRRSVSAISTSARRLQLRRRAGRRVDRHELDAGALIELARGSRRISPSHRRCVGRGDGPGSARAGRHDQGQKSAHESTRSRRWTDVPAAVCSPTSLLVEMDRPSERASRAPGRSETDALRDRMRSPSVPSATRHLRAEVDAIIAVWDARNGRTTCSTSAVGLWTTRKSFRCRARTSGTAVVTSTPRHASPGRDLRGCVVRDDRVDASGENERQQRASVPLRVVEDRDDALARRRHLLDLNLI
jgi:hypothetical protein